MFDELTFWATIVGFSIADLSTYNSYRKDQKEKAKKNNYGKDDTEELFNKFRTFENIDYPDWMFEKSAKCLDASYFKKKKKQNLARMRKLNGVQAYSRHTWDQPSETPAVEAALDKQQDLIDSLDGVHSTEINHNVDGTIDLDAVNAENESLENERSSY